MNNFKKYQRVKFKQFTKIWKGSSLEDTVHVTHHTLGAEESSSRRMLTTSES